MGIEEINQLKKMQEKANEHIVDARMQLRENANIVDGHLKQVQEEYHRVAEISGQAGLIINQIDKDFKEKTKLDYKDIIILFVAVGLQCVRQYVLSNEKMRITANDGDKMMEGILSPLPPSWQEILTESVPYDAIKTSNLFNYSTELSGATHRYKTLGHDPLLGWIFGTANILTRSLTKYDLDTFIVRDGIILRRYPLGVTAMLNNAKDFCIKDPKLLPIAIAKQAEHYGSDFFTKQGLPIPIIPSVNNELSKKMTKDWHIDMWSVSRGITLASFINQIIACIHRLFYDEQKDGTESMYEVRTRKILSYSNVIATGSNVIVSAITEDMTKLDVGGILVTLYRLVSDYKFINKVKKDFLKDELYNRIVGTDYDFMMEA